MRCERCGRDFAAGLGKCPHCGAAAHYGGNTEFYGKVIESKLTVLDLFSDIFKKHPKGTGAKMFMAGTPLSTPTPDRMLSEWQKPWLFARVFAVGILYALLCYGMAAVTQQPIAIYSLLTFGALITPISLLIFFWEANIPRDIPLYTVLLILVIGGILSIVFSIFFHNFVPGGAIYAPFIEEPGKLLAVAIFVYLLDTKYIFGGMLIGAAVGAGFECFECVYYILGVTGGSLEQLIFRNFSVLGGHLMWAAIEGGALVMAKGGRKLNPGHFANPKFLAYFASSVAMHFCWNGGLTVLFKIPSGTFVEILLCVAAIFVVFTLLKRAVAQVLAVADNAQLVHTPVSRETGAHAALRASSGPLAGSYFPLQQSSVTIGCDPSQCNIVLPAGTPGISRRHCTLELRPDGVYLMDHNSSYGTFWQSGQRIPPNQWVPVPPTASFFLGSQAVAFDCVTCVS